VALTKHPLINARKNFWPPGDFRGTVDFRMLALIKQPVFWNKKVQIAILVLATFVAMC
jgi:hypothetical protein